jgi:hypothetical protein
MKYLIIGAAVILFSFDGTAANITQLITAAGIAAYLLYQQTKEPKP